MVLVKNQKSLFVLVLGETNVGKSSLVNFISNSQISIVTYKKNTTKEVLPLIRTEGESQFVVYDTVGFISKTGKNFLGNKNFFYLKTSDLVILVLDGKKISNQKLLYQNLQYVISLKKDHIIVINKIDLLSLQELSKIQSFLNEYYDDIGKIFYISVKQNLGLDKLLKFLQQKPLPNQWLYPSDQITTKSTKFLAEEFTRETLLLKLQDEIPHKLEIKTDIWKETKNSIIIYQSIIANKISYKKIILGKNGCKIKQISLDAKGKIERMVNKKVHLYLFFKISKFISE
ncbi:MAG: GTPase Era [Rickettsia sp.]|nr:GTPase Era [Rickettsia sp.]